MKKILLIGIWVLCSVVVYAKKKEVLKEEPKKVLSTKEAFKAVQAAKGELKKARVDYVKAAQEDQLTWNWTKQSFTTIFGKRLMKRTLIVNSIEINKVDTINPINLDEGLEIIPQVIAKELPEGRKVVFNFQLGDEKIEVSFNDWMLIMQGSEEIDIQNVPFNDQEVVSNEQKQETVNDEQK